MRPYRLACLVFLALLAGCSAPTAAALPFSKEQAIARANQEAKQSVPEVGIQQARIDSTTAELITLAEADRRTGGIRGPGGYSPGQTPQSPVWWIVVRGYFQYEGMAAPPNPAPICEADERDFVYDARTSESVSESMPNTRCAQATSGTAAQPMTIAPTATAAPVAQDLPTATLVPTPILISPRLDAVRTPTPNRSLPVLSPTAAPTCPAPAATPTAPTSALNPPTPGSLDPTFGNGGILVSDTGSGAVGMALQADGKIVTVGTTRSIYQTPSGIALHRYNPDGSPDCAFGSGGAVFANPYGDSHDVGASAVAIQTDGKIVVVGTVRSEAAGDDILLLRYNSNGSPDGTFGDGGRTRTDLDKGSDWPRAVVLQSDGSILVSGNSNAGEHAADALSLARFHHDGSLDLTFGQDGGVITDMNRHGDGRALAVQSDGKIVVAGSGNSDLKMFNFALLRYNKDGSFDPTFGQSGIVLTPLGKDYDGANALAIQPDGKLVVAGRSSIVRFRNTLALLRYNTDGALDLTFGSGGQAIDNLTDNDTATAVVIQADGKIVVAGNAFPPNSAVGSLVARYNPDGSLDSAFGSGGRVITRVGINDTISALAIQADGKILAAGTTEDSTKCLVPTCAYASGLLLLRLLP
jgi:uncharacterized delta-60 repeat protein